ncbi:hypothetical protein EYZ11_003368 [Aspergillus tanneri]|uniref:Uncharacterized protein n=1 Tax=Aspergillus tanneri TaxID=1220188 RepID=A0A4S3JNH5_9EURO|nr:hypothetical protein EYZ11_003368 [Aspergillus tanneri]
MKCTTLAGACLFGALAPIPTIFRAIARSTSCPEAPSTLALSDPPYENYMYSDCNVAAQVVVTSPLPNSNLTQIGPRLIVAWPAGNSGVCAYFAPQNGINGSLAIEVINSTVGDPLAPVYIAPSNGSQYPSVGVTGVLRINASATLTVPILGSIRTIRDFVEGPSLLQPDIQDAIQVIGKDRSVSLQRLWLDNITVSTLQFSPAANSKSRVAVVNRTTHFEAGEYIFRAYINYPQLTQLKPDEVLDAENAALHTQQSQKTSALSFLSYSEKLLAGAWRFLTYFGRDSMISALLLEPVLSKGNNSAMEAVIGAVLERINRTDGSACHEETVGDYATWTNLQKNITSTTMLCDYKMVDTDYFLPILIKRYLVDNEVGQRRHKAFLSTPAGSINSVNRNLTWGQLSTLNAERIIRLAGPFAQKQTKENLIHLNDGEVVGQWRDSTYALVPAALRAISILARHGIYPHRKNWAHLAGQYADIWEEKALPFFKAL